MATFSGAYSFDTMETVPWSAQSYGATEGLVVGTWGPVESHQTGEMAGAFDDLRPVSFLTSNLDGNYIKTFYHDFYDRIWVTPNPLDLGNIGSETTAVVSIWNAYTVNEQLLSYTAASDPGVSVFGLATPRTLIGLEELLVQIRVSSEGAPEIDTSITFNFSSYGAVPLGLVGSRAIVWEFPPNWSERVETGMAYRTEVITSRSGLEQRIADRQTPRLSISFESMANNTAFRSFIRAMSASIKRAFLVPEYGREVHLADPVVAGDSVVRLEEVPEWAVAGRTVALLGDPGTDTPSETRKVELVVGDTLELNAPLGRDYPAGVKLYSMAAGRLGSDISAKQITNRTVTFPVSFNLDPGVTQTLNPLAPEHSYMGVELFLKRPNWSSPLSPEFKGLLEQVDYSFGRVSNFTPVSFNDRYHKATYLCRDRSEVYALERFFMRQMGQQAEFYMPTFTDDLEMAGPVSSGSSSIRVKGADVARDYVDLEVYRDIFIMMVDGSYQIRRITGMTVSTEVGVRESILAVDRQWEDPFTPDDVSQICWLPLWRFATDNITFVWHTDSVTETEITLKSLPHTDIIEGN